MNKGLKITRALLIALAAACIAYGLMVLSTIGTGHWFNFCFIIIGAALTAIAVFLKRITAWPKAVLIVLALVIAAVLVNFIAFEAKIIKCGSQEPESDAVYVIVLGAKVNGSNPSAEYRYRLDAAAEYAAKNRCVIITTGGQGADEQYPEGKVGEEYLISRYDLRGRVISEKTSTSTYENIENAKKLMTDLRKSLSSQIDPDPSWYDVSGEKIVIVTSKFHIYRAAKIAESLGFENVSFMGSVGKAYLLPHYYLREYAAYIQESLLKKY